MTLIESDALLVRTVEVRESDVIATFVTERAGRMAAVVHGARKGSRRLGGALEPMHTIAVRIDDKGGGPLDSQKRRIIGMKLRPRLVENLDALDAAGVALRWARHLFPPRTVEPEGWRLLLQLLDALDVGGAAPRQELARAGLSMLAAVGYALDLERCVVCARPCPEGKAACVDAARGGLVCLSCGGARNVLSAEIRDAARCLLSGAPADVPDRSAVAVLGLVDVAMAAHADFER